LKYDQSKAAPEKKQWIRAVEEGCQRKMKNNVLESIDKVRVPKIKKCLPQQGP
jgi:hypothetical protein